MLGHPMYGVEDEVGEVSGVTVSGEVGEVVVEVPLLPEDPRRGEPFPQQDQIHQLPSRPTVTVYNTYRNKICKIVWEEEM